MKIIELCDLLGIENEVKEKLIEFEKFIDFNGNVTEEYFDEKHNN